MRILSVLLLALVILIQASWGQACAADALSVSPESAVYETWRKWKSMLPPAEQDESTALERYRKYLISGGADPGDADRQISIIRQEGARLETERWNRILTAEQPRFNTQANAFLVQMVKGVTPGKALDVGMGQGRNAIYLAQQGWDVTGIDLADQAVAAAQRQAAQLGVEINAVVADAAEFDWGLNRWDLILLSYVPVRENASHVIASLRPGGLVVIEGAHVDATKSQSIAREVVFENNELIELFPGFRVLHYQDVMDKADFGSGEARLVRYGGQKVK